MKGRYFNKRYRRRLKGNLKKYGSARKLFSKRTGGVIGVSVLLENRNLNATELSNNKEEIR
jgi:hypothetical protein